LLYFLLCHHEEATRGKDTYLKPKRETRGGGTLKEDKYLGGRRK
jgi:hypothetical protein